ncbi:peptide-methionine (S)-S-oxide reductase MsrA [Hyphococcus sp.]|uniref:peptide-methionine (S)-S-oxide reductase MsrA n=1 Tax=Hyphococcus sp. TaxID=2038636 RepID=UPI003D0ABFA5
MTETAVFAAGCFWGVEQVFRDTDGVTATEVGYTGGRTENPTYKEVCAKGTGHAEAVKIDFDPAIVSYEKLLDIFWASHDPTQVNRQGPDVGDQYRTAIFTLNEKQREAAEKSRAAEDASGRYPRPIATKIEPLGPWWRAEEYHQQYFEKNGGGACHITPR